MISAGFITTVLPAASAGAIFQLVNISGKFHGTTLPDDADRLAQGVVQEPGLDRNRLALELVGHAAEVAIAGGGARHVQRPAVLQRMAGVEGLQARQVLGVGLDQVGQPQQDAAAVGGGHPAPGGQGALRGGHRQVDVGGPAIATSAMARLSCGFSVGSVSPPLWASTKRPSMNS